MKATCQDCKKKYDEPSGAAKDGIKICLKCFKSKTKPAKPEKPKREPKKKLYWCTTPDGDEDWFIIATSARQARSRHAGEEGYRSEDVESTLVTVLPEKWQEHHLGWPDLNTSILEDSGGVKVPYQPSSNKKLREMMGVVSEAWQFGDRFFVAGDIVANIEASLEGENKS